MEKKITDYLHLYLGCEYLLSGKRFNLTTEHLNSAEYYNQYPNIQLILRPLSDMSGKELMEVFHLSYEDSGYKFSDPFEKVDNNECGWRARNQNGMECFVPANSFKPQVFVWLLSKHFDLFNLIPDGLALNKQSL